MSFEENSAGLGPTTLAARHANGLDGRSGNVAPWAGWRDSAPGVIFGQQEFQPTAQLEVPRTPDSLLADRDMRGGITHIAAVGQYQEQPGNLGGYLAIANYAMPGSQFETMQDDDTEAGGVEWREAPAVTQFCRTVPTVTGANGVTGKKAL